METDTGPQTKGLLSQILSGGLPQALAGPAGAAISRLVGGLVDIPAAWLEQKAQAIRSETTARSTIMESLAKGSAERGLQDTGLLDRGLDYMLGKAYREQKNREEIAIKTIEHLNGEVPPNLLSGPAEDWMDIFSDYAAKASSESMRDLFGRVLAGEIRKPGQFSLRTLHFLSLLDAPSAALIEKIAPYTWENSVIVSALGERMSYDDLLILEQIGFLTMGAGMLTQWIDLDPSTNAASFLHGEIGISVQLPVGKEKVEYDAYPLTKAGIELLDVLNIPADVDALLQAVWAWNPSPEAVHFATFKPREDGSFVVEIGDPAPNPGVSVD